MKTIKDMPAYSRQRGKLRERGASILTDEELVAAILGIEADQPRRIKYRQLTRK